MQDFRLDARRVSQIGKGVVCQLTQLTPSSKNRCKTCSPPKIGCRTSRLKKSSNNLLRRAMTVASSLALL